MRTLGVLALSDKKLCSDLSNEWPKAKWAPDKFVIQTSSQADGSTKRKERRQCPLQIPKMYNFLFYADKMSLTGNGANKRRGAYEVTKKQSADKVVQRYKKRRVNQTGGGSRTKEKIVRGM